MAGACPTVMCLEVAFAGGVFFFLSNPIEVVAQEQSQACMMVVSYCSVGCSNWYSKKSKPKVTIFVGTYNNG